MSYKSVEHYFQSSKFTNQTYADLIIETNTPHKAFILGKQKKKGGYAGKWCVNKDNNLTLNDAIDKYKDNSFVKENWENIKNDIMYIGLKQKFIQNDKLKKLLLDTNNKNIIENSPRDYYWDVEKIILAKII